MDPRERSRRSWENWDEAEMRRELAPWASFSNGPLDEPLPEDDEIRAAHPTRTGRHDLYAEAMRLVGAKHSKAALVELVNWLLHRIES